MVKDLVKKFFSSEFNQWLVVALAVLGFVLLVWGPQAAQEQGEAGESFVHMFYLPGCPHCHEQINELNPVIESEYGVKVVKHDVTTEKGHVLFGEVRDERGLNDLVPLTLVGDKQFVGYSDEIGARIKEAVAECVESGDCGDPLTGSQGVEEEKNYEYDLPFIGKTDLRSFSLPVLAIVLGVVDGFNPCAMWVLVYLIALCIGLQSRKRMFFLVGTFVLVSGIMYFLFMTAWLNAFLMLGYTRAITILIGLVALGAGILNLKSWWETRNKALTCEVTSSETKEKQMKELQGVVSSPLTWGTIATIVVLAFAVNTIEFVCSAALPAIFTQILALAPISWIEHYSYIALYVLFFMLDDLIVFSIAVFGISSMAANEKYSKLSKLVGGLLILGIGLLLLFAPQLLR
jgi:glutaredoxin